MSPYPQILGRVLQIAACGLGCALSVVCGAECPPISSAPQTANDFALVRAGITVPIVYDASDAEVVKITAGLFADDVQRVSGVRPVVLNSRAGAPTGASLVLVGTIGHDPDLDHLIAVGQVNVSAVRGGWERYHIEVVKNPFPGVPQALVIAGSDRRGTAYGTLSISEAMGVSPWYWWADVPVTHSMTQVYVGAATFDSQEPSVRYRGIFINDEDWGLQPWAAKTFEPETKDIGPKTYAKVCELLLRLKANYLWPAMHPCTKAFNLYPQNKVVADNYAIVMGSSHAEPMLRNNVSEWNPSMGEWDYEKNRAGIDKYWEQRIQENGRYENTYTVGMRGIHDGAMPGGGTTADKVARLQQVIADQREMLARDLNRKIEQVPQFFVPYKEVLALYQDGLKVPDDVTLVWPDDNFGYIRQLSNPAEQKRGGGAGVYYHLSYWGKPEDYLWLCTTPPALIWEEMSKAYDNGARTVWVVNVGDIKPAEIGLDFFLRLAWNVKRWNETAQPNFLSQWAARNFGPENASEIAAIMEEFYRLNYPAKPEHLFHAQFTANYDETGQRLQRFARLVERTNTIYQKLPREKKDAFYELTVYPVRCSALMNERYLNPSPEQSRKAYEQIQVETTFYNEQIAGGKWQNMMSSHPRNLPVFQKPDGNAHIAPESVIGAEGSKAEDGYISIEAEHPTRKTDAGMATWKVVPGLGRTGDVITLLPTTANLMDAAALEYDFSLAKSGTVKAYIDCIPTHALYPGTRLRYELSIDAEPAQIVELDTAEFSKKWSDNVLRAAAIGTTEHSLVNAGKHTLKLHPRDPGIIFDKILLDLGGLKPSQLGPPESAPGDLPPRP